MMQKHLIILTNTFWSLQRQKHYHNLKILRSTYAPQSVKAPFGANKHMITLVSQQMQVHQSL